MRWNSAIHRVAKQRESDEYGRFLCVYPGMPPTSDEESREAYAARIRECL